MASSTDNPLHDDSSHPLHYSSSQHSLASGEEHESRLDRMQSIYEHLQRLADEISAGIVNLSGRPADVVYMDIDKLRAVSENEELPEAAFNHLLFRKYSELANDLLVRCKTSERVHSPTNTSMNYPDILTMVDELDEHELVGWGATKKAIFWYRFISAMFGFLTFAVMSSVPSLSEADYNPSYEFSVS